MTSTKMWRAWILCLFTLLMVEAQLDKRSSNAKRYCGRNLIHILQIVCDSNYYSNTSPTILNQKKSFSDDVWLQVLEESAADDDEPVFPFRSKSKAARFGHRVFRRNTRLRGVVDECCYDKGCTINELRGYCGSSR